MCLTHAVSLTLRKRDNCMVTTSDNITCSYFEFLHLNCEKEALNWTKHTNNFVLENFIWIIWREKKRNIFKLAIMHSQHRNYSEINFMVCTESWKKKHYAHLYLATSAGWLGWPKWFQSTCSKWKRRHLEA